MMDMAKDSIDNWPGPQRDISSLTLNLGPEGLILFKNKLKAFRRELLELSEMEPDPRQVIQVNFQLFPLSEATSDQDKP
jgi:uncharacterized protein (TIGR02147 family)